MVGVQSNLDEYVKSSWLVSVELYKCIEYFRVDKTLLFQCLERLAEVLDYAPVPAALLLISHVWDQTTAEHIVC